MIKSVVVDDDFRVAEVHTEYVRHVPGFEVVAVAHSLAQARAAIAAHQPDLVLLDLYLPDGSGLDLLHGGVGRPGMQTIVVTAARDVESVRAAMAGGAVNYLVKPFRRAQLIERLEAVRALNAHLSEISRVSQGADQADIDRAYRMLHPAKQQPSLPKGITDATLRIVRQALARHPDGVDSAVLEDELGVSRATVQRYLTFLIDIGQAELSMRYGKLGRPVHVYRAR